MMDCPNCHKRLPDRVRYCAYCGTAVSRSLLSTLARSLAVRWPATPFARLRLPRPPRWLPPALVTAAWGGVAGGVGGGVVGGVLGAPVWGALAGAAAVGLGASLGEPMAGPIFDRAAAERFGQRFGALGGGLVFAGGLLAGLAVVLVYAPFDGWRGLLALVIGGLYLGMFGAVGGGAAGVALGALAGALAAPMGQPLGRRGVVTGAALAWTLAAVVGGAFAGYYPASVLGIDRLQGIGLGVLVQLAAGLLLLRLAGPYLRRWRP